MSAPETNWRLFVGIALPAALTSPLTALQERLRAAGLFAARYPRPEHLHLTLKFLGAVPAAAAAAVADRLAAVRFAPFTATLAGLGTFGGQRPRVVWLGVTSDAIGQLQREIERVLVTPDETAAAAAYHPHLTLARLRRSPPGSDWQARLTALAPAPRAFTVDQFALLRSQLQPDGPRHTVIGRFPAAAVASAAADERKAVW